MDEVDTKKGRVYNALNAMAGEAEHTFLHQSESRINITCLIQYQYQ
jgi:hypothetical protein